MPVLNTNLNIRLTDGVSGPAKAVARSLINIKDTALGINGKSFGAGLVEPLRRAEIQMAGFAGKMRMQAKALRGEIDGVAHGFHGIGAALATIGIGHGMAHILGDGAELNKELLALKNAGRTTSEIADGFREASETIKKLPTTSLTENIKLLNETTGAFGNFHHALENLTFNAKLGSVMKSAFGDKLGDEGTAFNQIVRAFEIRGTAFDPKKYQEEAGRLAKAMIFTRGNVNPEQFLTFAQRANPSIKGFSTEFLTEIAPSLIQTFGGDQAGTGITAFEKVVKGGLTDKGQAKEWVRLGLISEKALQDNKGQSPGWKSGQLTGTNLAFKNPLDFMEQVVLPAIKRSGVDIMDPVALGKELDILFKNKRAQSTAYELGQAVTRAALRKDQRLIKIVPDLDAQYESNLQDIYTALTALKEGFKDVWATLSLQFMKPAAGGIVFLARQLQELAATIAEHPLLAKKLGIAAAIAGALTGLATMRASLRMLGLVGLNPIKALKATFLEMGAFFVGAGARGIRIMRLSFLSLLNPLIAVRGSVRLLGSALRMSVAATGIGALLLGADFIINNWKGVQTFFSTFTDTLRKNFAGSGDLFGPIIQSATSLLDKVRGFTAEIDPAKWGQWGTAAANALTDALKAIEGKDWTSTGLNIAKAIGGGIKAAAVEFGPMIWDGIKTYYQVMVPEMASSFLALVKKEAPGWIEAGKEIALSIAQGLETALMQAVQALMGRIQGMLPSFLGGGGGGGGGLGGSFYGGRGPGRAPSSLALGGYSPPNVGDDELAVRTMLAEAGGEGPEGMEAVGHVLLNRRNSGKYGKSVGDVIRQNRQFSAWNSNDPAGRRAMGIDKSSPEYQRAYQAWQNAKAGGKDPTNGATHYYNPNGGFGMTHAPAWADPDHQTTIGHHVFQKDKQARNGSAYQPNITIHVAGGDMDHRKLGDRIAEKLHEHFENFVGASYADTGFA